MFNFSTVIMAIMIAISIAFILGFIDDIHSLSPKIKVLISALAGLPIVISKAYDPNPFVPIVGQLRITLIYPLLVLAAYAVLINASNMFDTHNGLLPSVTLIIISSTIPLQLYLVSKGIAPMESIVFSLITLGALIGYLPFNMYPAKVFNGNSGSHFIGAILASLTIISRLEVVMIISIMPLVINGFNLIMSIRGLRRKEQIERPVILMNDYSIKASPNPKSPITLVQLLTLRKSLYEPEIVLAISILVYVFCILASIIFLYAYP